MADASIMALSHLLPVMIVCLALCIPSTVLSQTLNYQHYLSDALADNPPNSTVGNVNIVQIGSGGTNEAIEVAYFPYLIRFTCGDGIPVN